MDQSFQDHLQDHLQVHRSGRHQEGFILVAMLSLAVFVLLLGSGMAFMAQNSLQVGGNARANLRARVAADAALESGLAVLKAHSGPEQLQNLHQHVVTAPLAGEMQGTAVLSVLQHDATAVLVQMKGEGQAENHARHTSLMVVQGTHQSDPDVFAGVVSMDQVVSQGTVALQNGAILHANAGQMSLASPDLKTVEVPVPQVQSRSLLQEESCQGLLGDTLLTSQVQADALFPAKTLVCVQGNLAVAAPLVLKNTRILVQGKLTLSAGSLLENSLLEVKQTLQAEGLEVKDSSVLAQQDMVFQDLKGTGRVLLASAEHLTVVHGQQNNVPASSLTLIAQQNLSIDMQSDLQGIFWAGGKIMRSGPGKLWGAMAAVGSIDLGKGSTVVKIPGLGQDWLPGKYRFRVISRK
ncbi:hypothetical protein [Deinococcus roseus]|uniref:Flp pilus-assembly TadG-like N-terminal domain-containing protein n=1 Tax=Deinococcus roseus TaxID=392414 RepID=A0ABQ2CTB3_9DEIO|nr:hypothetical protein [Deinococcus roseus]GGJ19139.1 hypothetical protein GCM10008938_01440 [Deinococcus roseus]